MVDSTLKHGEKIQSKILNIQKKLEMINIHVHPTDVFVSTSDKTIFQHQIVNNSKFDVICRVKATSARYFYMLKNIFTIEAGQTYTFEVQRFAHPIKSHRLTLEILPETREHSQEDLDDLHCIFEGIQSTKQIRIRYHKPPSWLKTTSELYRSRDLRGVPSVLKICDETKIRTTKGSEMTMNEINVVQMSLLQELE